MTEMQIAAIRREMDRHTSLSIAAETLVKHHREELARLHRQHAALVAQRSPETVARIEKERGLA